MAKTNDFRSLVTGWHILEGAWSCPKRLSTLSRTRNWMKVRANSGKSTATAVDLPAVLQRWANFLYTLDIIKTTDAVFDPSRRTLHTDTRMCSPLEEQAATSPSLDRFRFHRTELQLSASVSSTVLYSASCRRFQSKKGPICVSYTVFHDHVGQSSERIHNQRNETMVYHQGGEEGRGWLSAKVHRVAL